MILLVENLGRSHSQIPQRSQVLRVNSAGLTGGWSDKDYREHFRMSGTIPIGVVISIAALLIGGYSNLFTAMYVTLYMDGALIMTAHKCSFVSSFGITVQPPFTVHWVRI